MRRRRRGISPRLEPLDAAGHTEMSFVSPLIVPDKELCDTISTARVRNQDCVLKGVCLCVCWGGGGKSHHHGIFVSVEWHERLRPRAGRHDA